METSATKAIYLGTYIFVFVAAFTVTIYLFSSILEFSEEAYDFETKQANNQVIVNVPVEANRLLTSTEVASYYYNYVKKDLYSDKAQNNKYKVIIKNEYDNEILDRDSTRNYKTIISELGENSKYILRYDSVDANGIPTITLKKASEEEINAMQ